MKVEKKSIRMYLKNNIKNIIKISNVKRSNNGIKICIAFILIFSIIFTNSFMYANNLGSNKNISYANTNYEMPSYIRVGLTNNFANKSKITFLNKSIVAGYNPEKFTYDATFSCDKGFYLELNTSERFISSNTYKSFDEVKSIIGDSNDYIPMFLEEGAFKIATKDGRTSSDIASENYSDKNSIVLISGDYKELAIFDAENYPLFSSGDKEEVHTMKLSSSKYYRGFIQIVKQTNGLTAVNHVLFDEYLYGVITSEMPSSWHIEANKAQAVVARTFAYKKYLSKRFTYYDLVDTTSDQVYGGYKNETATSKKSTDLTTGEVIIYIGDNDTYNGKLIDAFFSSSDGGVTEEAQNVWSANLPYLKSKKDPYEDKSKHYGWTCSFTIADLNNAMKAKGENIGNVTGCTITPSKDSGRVLKFNIVGTKGTFTVSKDSIRSFFTNYMPDKINSTNFELFVGTQSEVVDTITKKTVYVANSASSIQKLFENVSVLKSDKKTMQEITKNVYAINGDGKVIELPITGLVKSEVKDTNLKKGEYKIVGNGFGHGVGMSQYGAKGMADKGFNYKDIIKFYYTDTDIIYIK